MKAPHSVIVMFGEIMARYQQDGLLKEGDPVLAVTQLLGPIIVNTMLRSANPELDMPPIELDELVDRYLNGNRTL